MRVSPVLAISFLLGGALAIPATNAKKTSTKLPHNAPSQSTKSIKESSTLSQVSASKASAVTGSAASAKSSKEPSGTSVLSSMSSNTITDAPAPTAEPTYMLGTLQQVWSNMHSVSRHVQVSMTAEMFVSEGACKSATTSSKASGLQARATARRSSKKSSGTARASKTGGVSASTAVQSTSVASSIQPASSANASTKSSKSSAAPSSATSGITPTSAELSQITASAAEPSQSSGPDPLDDTSPTAPDSEDGVLKEIVKMQRKVISLLTQEEFSENDALEPMPGDADG